MVEIQDISALTTVLPDGRVVQAVDPNREFKDLEARFVLKGEAGVVIWRGDGKYEPEDCPGRTEASLSRTAPRAEWRWRMKPNALCPPLVGLIIAGLAAPSWAQHATPQEAC